jgi:CheY-like chemotaxis protein
MRLEQGASGRGKKFLVLVDGNSRDLLRTGMLLQRLNYNIFTSGGAEEALQYLSIAVPAALITELLLPAMNGMALIERVKNEDRTKRVPIIVHTSIKDPKIEELCLVAGCAAYLTKPVDPNTLYRTIQHAIETTPRHYIRLSTCFPVAIADDPSPDVARTEYVSALSENGLFILTYRPRPVGSVFSLRFFVYERLIDVRAIVLYTFTTAGGPLKEPGMGLKFIEISDADRQFIQTFIRDQLTRDILPAAAD